MKFLTSAMNLLESYSAVGIMEEFDDSMRLYDAALGMPGMEWEKRNTNVYNTVRSPVEAYQAELLDLALTDPTIREYMWLDMILYDYAKDLFEKSLVERRVNYDVTTSVFFTRHGEEGVTGDRFQCKDRDFSESQS